VLRENMQKFGLCCEYTRDMAFKMGLSRS